MKQLVLLSIFAFATIAASSLLSGTTVEIDWIRAQLRRQVGQRSSRLADVSGVSTMTASFRSTSIRSLLTSKLDDQLTGKRLSRTISTMLRRADIEFKASEFLLSCVLTAFGLACLVVVFRQPWSVVTIAFVAGLGFPFYLVDRRSRNRVKAFDSQLPDCLLMLTNSLKSGYSLLQAIDVVSRDMPEPLSREFDQVVRESRVNISLEESLKNLLVRMPSPDLDLVITAILIQRQVGGNLGEVFQAINGTIRNRITIKGQIQTLTAEGRISGWIVGALPVAIAGAIMLLNPGYLQPMFSTRLGQTILGAGVLMQALGAFFIHRIINIEV